MPSPLAEWFGAGVALPRPVTPVVHCEISPFSPADLSDDNLILTAYPQPVRPSSHLAATPAAAGRSDAAFSGDVVVSYVGHMVDLPGRLDVAKAKALGLKPGPVFRQLKEGETVVNSAGDTVRPEQVLHPAQINPAFAIVDCPTLDRKSVV